MFRRPIAWLVLIGLWECTSKVFPAWPSAFDVGRVLVANFQQGLFQAALLGSLRRMAIGYVLVVVIGITTGMVLGRFRFLDELVGSLTVAIHAIPGAAWVPLAVMWFGMTERAVIFTIFLGATGIVMVSTDSGIRDVPPLIVRAARTMGAKGVRYFWFVVVPAAIPKIVDGLRLSWAFGWRALMAGELLTSIPGLGQLLSQVAKARQLDQLLAIMVLIAAIGITMDELLFKRLDRAVRLRWGLA